MNESVKESVTKVWCKTCFTGFHRYADAPENVRYLSYPHRHRFHVKVSVLVSHYDRDVEFHTLQNDVFQIISNNPLVFGTEHTVNSSCEYMALFLYDRLSKQYLYEVDEVEVSEDGENGATVTARRDQ